ncbi:MAG TPA: lipid-A-disaccharide synthase-related protein [Candidatus Baltobacteraceae bacterium]
MAAVLLVSNGHGESAIAGRLARELRALRAIDVDHLPLVFAGGDASLASVGPTAKMPSGGLVAMGNVRAFSRDLRAGFLRLFLAQVRFLRNARGYDCVIAVGDVYALALALLAGRPTLFVGTAKSAYVAEYGPFERFVLRRAQRIFVRDETTAAHLRARGVRAQAPGNVIVDLLDDDVDVAPQADIGILPGSREPAYEDGVALGRVVRASGARALFSIAPGLDEAAFARLLTGDGWAVTAGDAPTPLRAHDPSGAELIAWRGSLGALLRAVRLVIGQAGTANEAAAACGVPVLALQTRSGGWYRMRQQRLLGDAIALIPAQPQAAAAQVHALLGDPARLSRMSAAGRERMGPPGGAHAIAEAALPWLL